MLQTGTQKPSLLAPVAFHSLYVLLRVITWERIGWSCSPIPTFVGWESAGVHRILEGWTQLSCNNLYEARLAKYESDHVTLLDLTVFPWYHWPTLFQNTPSTIPDVGFLKTRLLFFLHSVFYEIIRMWSHFYPHPENIPYKPIYSLYTSVMASYLAIYL